MLWSLSIGGRSPPSSSPYNPYLYRLMASKFVIEIEFPDRPLSSDLIAATKMLGELIAQNYAFPFDAEGLQTLGFGEDRQQIKWKLQLKEESNDL